VTSSKLLPAACLRSDEPCEPFLKWPGGKRWAAARIVAIVRQHLTEKGTYFEPFLGGGAVYFHLRPARAVLSDVNGDLVSTYRTVKSSPNEVLRRLRRLPVTKRFYYRIRDAEPRTRLGRAVRFLYLNRTAFGGIYRLNRDGRFNVPYGGGQRTPAMLWERALIARASIALKGAELVHADFESTMQRAGAGDVVYCDPTYTVAHDNNGFVRYNERNFSWSDQARLTTQARLAARRGAAVIISNAHHDAIRELYGDVRVTVLDRISRVSASPKGRVPVAEYLFVVTNPRR